VHFQPVVDQIVRAHPLDPLYAIVFAIALAVVALSTARRPALGFCALVATVPFALYCDVFGTTVTLPKVALLGVLLGLTAHRDRIGSLAFRPARGLLYGAAAVFLALAISIVQAGSHAAAVREVLKLVEYILAFLAAYACYRLDPDEGYARAAIALTVVAVSIGAIAQEFGGAPSGMWFNNVVIPRIAGALEGPNQLAGYLEIGIALLGAFACARPRLDIVCALGVAAFALVLTFSRSGIIGAGVAVAVIAVVYRRAALAMLAPVGIAALAGIGVAGIWAETAHTAASNLLRISTGSALAATGYSGGVGSRSELWHAAFALWKRHPIFGVGAGNFELDLPQVGLTGVRTHANSLYLQALVEGGLPLFAATVYFVSVSIASFVRRAAASPLVAGALAASIALALHQIFDYLIFYPKVGEMWWLVLALGAACL